MLELDDLVDLGEELRRRDFRVAPDQLLSAQLVLQALRGESIANSRADLISYLGPIFCTSAADQRRFTDVYRAWVKLRFHETLPQQSAAKATVHPVVGGRRSLRWKPLAVVIALMMLLVGVWGAWQHLRLREVIGTVVSADGEAIQGAVVTLGDETSTTSGDGAFRMTLSASELPIAFNVSKTDYHRSSDLPVIAEDLQSRRKWLYLGLSIRKAPIVVPAVVLVHAPPAPVDDVVNIEFPPEIPRPTLDATLEQSIDLTAKVPRPGFFQRLIFKDAALSVAPLLAFLLLQLWRAVRRPALQRLASRTPPELRDVHLPGGISALTPGLPMRRLAQELRRRRLRRSAEMRTDATISATLRNNGVFTPVFGSRVEPDYLVLVDAACLSDHQARLADELIRELLNGDVLIERYSFHDTPGVCEPAEATLQSGAQRSKRDASVELAELQARYPEHRVLLFTDGSGLFDPFTGAPSECVETLLDWDSPFILTSRPETHWSNVEWVLESLGFKVLPLNRAGFLALMNSLSGAPERAYPRGGKRILLSLHDRSPRRWLEREPPDDADIARLCDELEKELGKSGFAWLASCAAYPEIHWGITLRLGAVLVPDRTQFEALLPSLARLVWLREAYMPDWLRTELLNRLDPRDETMVRGTLHEILGSLSRQPSKDVPLRIASDPAPTHWLRAFIHRLRMSFARWRKRQRAEAIIRSTPAASPLRDYVFLRFLYGQSLGKLAISAPGALLRILFRGGSPLLGFRSGVALSAALVISCVIGMAVGPFHSGKYVVVSTLAHFSSNGEVLALPFVAGFFSVNDADSDPTVSTSFGVAMVEGGEVRRTIELPKAGTDAVRIAVAMSDDLNRLAFLEYRDGVPDRAIVWDLAADRPVAESQVRSCDVSFTSCVELSPDGTRVAFAVSDTDVDIVEIDSGRKISVSVNQANTLAFDTTGQLLATVTMSEVAVWDARSGRRLGMSSDSSDGRVESVAFSADGRTLFEANDARVTEWDRATGGKVRDLLAGGGDIAAITLQRSGKLLSVLRAAKSGNEVTLVDTTNGASFNGIAIGAVEHLRMAFSPDERRLGIALVAEELNSRAEVWRVPEGNAVAAPTRSFALVVGNDESVTGASLSNAVRDARSVAAVLRDRYGFGVTLLENTSTALVRNALNQYANILQPADQLLIFLAGMGSDDGRGGFAFPGSQGPDTLSGGEIGQAMRTLRAANVLIVLDAHRGALLNRESALDMPNGLVELIASSSGLDSPSDGEPDVGSPFTVAFVESLASGTAARSAGSTFAETRSYMSRARVQQVPFYAQWQPTGPSSSFMFPTPRTPPMVTSRPRDDAIQAPPLPASTPSAPPASTQPTNVDSPNQTAAAASVEPPPANQPPVAPAENANRPLEVRGDVTIESVGPVVDFSNPSVATDSRLRTVILSNPRPTSVHIVRGELRSKDGTQPPFSVKDSCSDRILQPNQQCEVVIEFSSNQRIQRNDVLAFTDGYTDLAVITLRSPGVRPSAPTISIP